MRFFLDDFIDSLTTYRKERVSDLLNEVKVGKEQLDSIADKLLGLGEFFPLTLVTEDQGSAISSAAVGVKFRDIYRKVATLYEASNLVSLLLDSHAALLSSDIKAVEDELLALEKMANNYAFLLSDGATFNYAYLEPFSDEKGRDAFSWDVPDRASLEFGPQENAIVRSSEGILALSDDLIIGHAITPSVLKGNANAFKQSDTGIQNCVTTSSATGWKVLIAAPSPVVQGLPESGDTTGVQMLLEFRLSQPAPSCEIKIGPIGDTPMQLLQATIHKNDDDYIGTPLLSDLRVLDRPTTLHFPMQFVSKFQLLVNQPTYGRVAEMSNNGEDEYRKVWESFLERRGGNRSGISIRLQGVVRLEQFEALYGHSFGAPNIPTGDYQARFGALGLSQAVSDINTRRFYYIWEKQDNIEQSVVQIFRKRFPQWDEFFKLAGRAVGTVERPVRTLTIPEQLVAPSPGFNYQYKLGLRNVAIGIDVPGTKGVFVSKTVPAPGDIGEIRLKVSDQNYQVPNTDRSSPWITSVEYSISNMSTPKKESDWIPIMPVGTSTVTAERFFPDETGKGYFRFPADRSANLSLYKNGYLLSNVVSLYDIPKQTTLGLQLLGYEVNVQDIFTCDYTPAYDDTTINLESLGFTDKPLVAAHDNDGAGEGFTATGDRNTATLSFSPYIDYSQVASSNYSSAFGMTPYQPITVRFEDGTSAHNLTDYKNQTTVGLSAVADYSFLHSGDVIIFNKEVTQGFRVFYQYLQNDIRVRVVLRVNDPRFVSPTVDFFHLKAKTRRSDPARM